MKRQLPLDEENLARFCELHHIRRLSLFGSQLKGTARPDSDIAHGGKNRAHTLRPLPDSRN